MGHLKDCRIYAVDFDGTLCERNYPGFGKPNWRLIDWLIERRGEGDKVILWTNRVGKYLKDAVTWCRDRGLEFDAVNENVPEILERYAKTLEEQNVKPSPKVTADVFIDDAACCEGLPFNNPGCPLEECWKKDCRNRRTELNMPVSRLPVTNRTRNALGRAGIDTLAQLRECTERQLMLTRAIGPKSIAEVKAALADLGLSLSGE